MVSGTTCIPIPTSLSPPGLWSVAPKIWGFGNQCRWHKIDLPQLSAFCLVSSQGSSWSLFCGGGFCPHQCPQRMLSASSAHSPSLSVSTLTPWRSHPSAEIAWIDTSRPPPAVAQCGRGSGRLLSPKLSFPLLPCLRDSPAAPSSLPVKGNGWQLHPSMCPGPDPTVSPASLLRSHVEATRRPTGPSFKIDPESDHDSPPCSHRPGQDPSSSPLPGVPASTFAPPPSLYSGGGCPMTT